MNFLHAQTDSILSLQEYLGYVKKYHPIVKQARLTVAQGEAKLLKARGSFDPKIEVDYDRKKFKNTEYYDKLNTSFKIPTWYGIELKANYERNDGTYLNPEFTTPTDGLYSAGVSLSLAKGLLTNRRMATLKQAKLYTQISNAQQQLLINDILYDAIDTYFLWLKNHQELKVYTDYKSNAKIRLQNVIKSFKAGDKAEVDTLEANINYKNRLLDLEKAKISFIKSIFEISNYLWLENNLPIELNDNIFPDDDTLNTIDVVLNSSILNVNEDFIENHPKVKMLELKKQQLNVERKLKLNNLLPKIDAQYNFLTSDYDNLRSLSTSNYKAGVNISFPIFLRKERGDLKLAKLKLQDIDFDLSATKVSLQNKIRATQQQIQSYLTQNSITSNLVNDYKKLVNAEQRKFDLGEGSLFLINYREAKLIETELKSIQTVNKILTSKATLTKYIVNF
ncbi:transporter [Tenacibaculum holothuriorum]|uniref:Transporter n=1 Tax=Tenacibaculum holothuriorum TaxID=1635173 RepID=A0A1Y2PF24_9FLAO|nr:transporter [Tenacibaculum holothuriorum]